MHSNVKKALIEILDRKSGKDKGKLMIEFFLTKWAQGGDVWLLNPPTTSLGFLLAQQGFDVWIANTRTTRFSYGHATFTRKDKVTLSSITIIISIIVDSSYCFLSQL